MTADHWEKVRAIYIEGIESGNATFETEAPDWDEWNRGHIGPCRMVALRGREVAGWVALSAVSRRAAYAGVAEVSVYVAADARGGGIGHALLTGLIPASEDAGFWTLQASVFPENEATLRLHRRAGFREVGRRERIGRHQGRWRDTILLERRSSRAGID